MDESVRLVKRFVAAVLVIALFAFAAAIVAPQPARGANAQQVQVTNTPLPVQIANSAVPVSGTVGVNSLPAVSGTVGVDSLPPVTLSGTPQVGVSNTSSTPLFVDAERAARSAVTGTCALDFPSQPTQLSCQLATVPPGSVLVIETVTCRAAVPTGAGFGPVNIDLAPPGSQFYAHYDLALVRANSIQSSDTYAISTPLRLYAAESYVGLTGVGSSGLNSPGYMRCSIVGYLVSQ